MIHRNCSFWEMNIRVLRVKLSNVIILYSLKMKIFGGKLIKGYRLPAVSLQLFIKRLYGMTGISQGA